MKNKARFNAERGGKPAAGKQHILPGVAPLALPDLKALLNEALTLLSDEFTALFSRGVTA